MADSMVALIVISIGIISLFLCQQQLGQQERQSMVKLQAARLAKEASAGVRDGHNPITVKRGSYLAQADQQAVAVYDDNHLLLRVHRWKRYRLLRWLSVLPPY